MDERLKSLSKSKDKLSCVLFVQDGQRDLRTERLLTWANTVEGQELSEAKSTIIHLMPKDGAFRDTIKIDDIRDLLSKLSLKLWDSSVNRYVLIPYAENLTASSSNALLKVLEEPPEGTKFFLMASSRKQILDTILSRSLVVNMPTLKESSLEIHENAFYRAFFKQDFTALTGLKRDETQAMWAEFYEGIFEFVRLEKVNNPADFFEAIEGVSKRINIHMDNKWLSSFIKRSYLEG